MATVLSVREDQLAAIDAAGKECQTDASRQYDGDFTFDRGKVAALWHDDGFVHLPCDDEPGEFISLRLLITDSIFVDDAETVRSTLVNVLRNLADAIEKGGAA